jgi:hypothetical protein
VTVSNSAGAAATSGTVTVTDTVPSGLTLAGISGSGWTCSGDSCSRSDSLAPGSSYPAISVMVNVQSNAPASVTNTATVSGGGDSSTNNKTASNVTTVNPLQFTLTTKVSPAATGTVTPSSGSKFNSGTVVALDATADKGYKFASWTGKVANENHASTTITMNSAQTVTANFVPEATKLEGIITGKSGPANARAWALSVTNKGPGVANTAELTSFTLTQTAGATCKPVVAGSFPLSLGDFTPGATKAVNVTIDFAACAADAKFTLDAKLSASAGAAVGAITGNNQSR